MVQYWFAVMIAVASAFAPGVAVAAEVESDVMAYPGVQYTVYVDRSIPAIIHVVRADISSSELVLEATTEAERGKTPSQVAAASDAQIIINGDFFSPLDFRPAGLAMGATMLWSNTADDTASGFLRFDRLGGRAHVTVSPPADEVAATELPPGTEGVVGGRPMLLRAGATASSRACDDPLAMPCQRAPRSAAAVSSDGNTLWLVVVDGWQPRSLGMTAAELGRFLQQLGAYDALMLDGGASSALYIGNQGGIVNAPSDGVERAVANHLRLRYGALEPGQLVGFVRARDIFDAEAAIAGANVRLDDGTTTTTDSTGLYNFPAVDPRYACVTAAAPGYRAATACKQVYSQQTTYNSVALFPGTDAPDAGVPPVDAGASSDAAGPVLGDDGDEPGSAGADDSGRASSGGCNSSGPNQGLACLLVLLAITPLFRRTVERL